MASVPQEAAPRVAGVLLAAGGGRRLGGRPKALLPHHGRPLVEHAVRALAEGGCSPLYVVLGAAPAREVAARADLAGCVLLDNPDWAEGMGTSLRLALDALGSSRTEDGVDAALFSLVDQPGIGADAVARVRGACDTADTLAAACYGGRRGHPVLAGARHWAGIAEGARGDQGARSYLRAHAGELALVECGDIASPEDIDTPEDLKRLEA
ncbi:nucleotidyltransferase family protein [Streptomyces sp. ODS28]|uniref:nucleotidyltransferase family protein n=1 Tax=Streptomyces sp. ODS28 TaxID=3136688 RepID=UPI0031EA7F7E